MSWATSGGRSYQSSQQTPQPPPQQKASKKKKETQPLSDVKAFLYAWLGQNRGMKPEYEVEQDKNSTKMSFVCQLTVPGINRKEIGRGLSKKEAQSKAAWKFVDYLINTGWLQESEVPPRPNENQLVPETAKPIKGPKPKEIKSFFYSWLGKRKLEPEYDIEQEGIQPQCTFICRLTVKGIDHEEVTTSMSKKDAQSKCAWNFVDYMVAIGMIKESEVPLRPTAPALGTAPIHGSKIMKEVKETDLEVFQNGGWTLSNSRQRLNQFLQREHCFEDTQYKECGQDHNRTFVCEIKLQVYFTQKEYCLYEIGTDKKQAKALCALAMVRKLYHDGLIERCGDPCKTLEPDRNLNHYAAPLHVYVPEIEVKKPQGALKAIEKGSNPVVKEKKATNVAKQNTEAKEADPLTELYTQAKKIYLLNTNEKTQQVEMPAPYNTAACLKSLRVGQFVSRRHKEIYPTELELKFVQKAVQRTEEALTEIAEELKFTWNTPLLKAVVRVGDIAKGLLLHNNLNKVDLVLMCMDIPTKTLFNFIFKGLELKFQGCSVSSSTEQATITISFKDEKTKEENNMEASSPQIKVDVKISVTSQSYRSLYEQNNLPNDALESQECVKALTEIRRAKWFQVRAACIPNCVIVIRILRSLKNKSKEWSSLDDWLMELIVATVFSKAKSSHPELSTGLLKVFQFLGSCHSQGGSEVKDPCHKSLPDLTKNLSQDVRESICNAAKKAIKFLTAGTPEKIPGFEQAL